MVLTQNEGYGFFGTICAEFGSAEADRLWRETMRQISHLTQSSEEDVRALLDSRHGRLFAGMVIDQVKGYGKEHIAAVEHTVRHWDLWTVRTSAAARLGVRAGRSMLETLIESEAKAS